MSRPSAYAGRGRPAWMDAPATGPQKRRIRDLAREIDGTEPQDVQVYAAGVLGRDLPDGRMTAGEASQVIDALQAIP